MKPKVFCIGFHKTGTKSLAAALRTLGYSVTGPNGVKDPNIGNNVYAMAFDLAERFDAFQDNPWPIIYKELDKRYPGSKFVLSVRGSDSWIKSRWSTSARGKLRCGSGSMASAARRAMKKFTSEGSKPITLRSLTTSGT